MIADRSKRLFELVREPKPGVEGLARKLLCVEDKDLSISGVADNLRLYLLCGAIISGAIVLARRGVDFSMHSVEAAVVSIVLALVAFALMALNVGRGMVIASGLGANRLVGLLVGLVSFGVFCRLAVVIGLAASNLSK